MSQHTLLVCTVGGSTQPIITSIKGYRPDLVYFLCSDDAGATKGSYVQVPHIVARAGLGRLNYKEHRIKQFDSLDDCYEESCRVIEEVHCYYPDARVIVDYTGGTKSMSAGVVAAALDNGPCEIGLVAGMRTDLEKVVDKTEFIRSVQVWHMQVTKQMKTAQALLSRFDYSGAEKALEEAARVLPINIPGIGERVQKWLVLCRAFDAWDRFDHLTAGTLLKAIGDGWTSRYKTFLGVLINERGHGFELVEDLLLNAGRRAVQGRYDDAVGRLYRALELTAQVWLKQRHDIDTGNLDLSRVPEAERARYERKPGEKVPIKLVGLIQAWDLVARLREDPLGTHFSAVRQRVLAFLEVRNQSLFAHGWRPVSKEDYDNHGPFVGDFLTQAVELALKDLKRRRIVTLAQLPVQWPG